MEILYSARRIDTTTSLRWFVFDDDVYSGYAITLDGERIEVDDSNINEFYDSPPCIKFTNKTSGIVTHTKNKASKVKPAETTESNAGEPKSNKNAKTKVSKKETSIKPVVFEVSTEKVVSNDYHKVLYSLYDPNSDFHIEVDGTEDDALTLKNELSKRHNNLVLKKKTIRSMAEVIDRYTTIVHKRKGKVIFEMDFDDSTDASKAFEQRLSKHPNDNIRMYHVEETI